MEKQKKKEYYIKVVLVLANFILILGAVLGSIFYTRVFREENKHLQLEAFETTVESMKQLSTGYLYTEKGYADDWAAYIKHENMTMEEALEYIRTSNTQEDRYAHIVDMEDFSARSTYIRNGDEEVDCYKEFEKNVTNKNKALVRKMERMFENDNTDDVQVLGKYRVGESQQNVISVGTRVTLNEGDGSTKDYLLLRVIPVDYLKSAWVFPTEYPMAEIGIITTDGEYVIQSVSMKSRSFLDYIRGYNFQDDYNKVEELADELHTTEQGTLYYKDSKNRDCYWYYSSFGRNSELDILGYIPAEQIDSVNMNWNIVFIICGVLLILVILDGSYILVINRRLHKAVAAAGHANHAKTEFLSSVSHDIRTPMNAVIGMTDIAKKHIDDPSYVEDCLNKVSLAGNHLLTLINDILDISKVESGKMVLTLHEMSLKNAVDEIVSIVRSRADENGITLETNFYNITKDCLIADQLRLNQIMINLLTNAIKYSNAGGRVVFDIAEEEIPEKEEGIRLICKIADNGIGMSEEFQKNMYQSFIRAEDSRIDTIQGSGLGLTITKQLVDLMDGTITCDSHLGEGTTFTVTLEFMTKERTSEERGTTEAAAGAGDHEFEAMHILVAEDNDLNWEIIETLLKERGISCERAVNGQECLDMLDAAPEHHFTMVFMDIQMPVMNGREATRKIRESEKESIRKLPVIAMTADAFAEDIRECREAGMDGHIAKPIDMKQVLRILPQYT